MFKQHGVSSRHRIVRGRIARSGILTVFVAAIAVLLSASTASAVYRPAGEPGNSTDLGGGINMLNPSKSITKKTHSIRANTSLIQMEKWTGVDTWKRAEAV